MKVLSLPLLIAEQDEIDAGDDEAERGVDLSESHRGRWRRDLGREEHAALQELLGPMVEQLGYAW